MFTPGTLVFFNPFTFADGSAKPKFFLVLANSDNETIVASLPSSQNHLPTNMHQQYGCIESPESSISAFVMKAGELVTTNGWAFDKDSFLYGFWLDSFEQAALQQQLQEKQVNHSVIGVLEPRLFKAILACFAQSAIVKRKFKRVLQAALA